MLDMVLPKGGDEEVGVVVALREDGVVVSSSGAA